MSDDRKYRQRGYQDSDRGNRERGPSTPRPPREPFDPRIPRDPRTPNMPGFKQTFRCVRCGHEEDPAIGSLSRCTKCGVALRACIQCGSFDSGAVYECLEKIPARVSPKDEANACEHFSPRMKVERETHSAPAPPSSSGSSGGGASAAARKAFDDLFKK
jgi:transcription elongation factor Elf1